MDYYKVVKCEDGKLTSIVLRSKNPLHRIYYEDGHYNVVESGMAFDNLADAQNFHRHFGGQIWECSGKKLPCPKEYLMAGLYFIIG